MDGTTVGERYRIARQLARGAFGVVYEADDLRLGGKVAIKVLDATRLSAESVARFLREAEAATRLTHAAAVRTFDRGQTDDGRPWLAMELLEGETLAERLQRGVLYPAELVELFRPLCELLGEAHDKGIVHRDLKPGNVMLVPVAGGGWSPKLIDFGIAALLDADTLTSPEAIGGTPRYMAPEQWQGLTHADARSDLYSLGVIAYECLSGRLPFEAEGALAWMNKHRYEAPRDLRDAMAGRPLPAGMRATVMKALGKDPAERPPSALAFWRELAAGLEAGVRGDDDDAGATLPPPTATAAVTLAPLTSRSPIVSRRRLLTWAVPAAVVPAALGAVWFARRRTAATPACPPLAGPYMPLTVGSTWKYAVRDPSTGRVTEKVIGLDREEVLGGRKAGMRAVRLNRVDGEGSALRWLSRVGEAVVWQHEQWFDKAGKASSTVDYEPWRMRVDDACAHRRAGARWVLEHQRIESFTSGPLHTRMTQVRDEWTVLAVDEPVTVAAGTFRALRLHLRRTGDTELVSTYWFVAGVGKVREDSSKEHEELLAYEIA